MLMVRASESGGEHPEFEVNVDGRKLTPTTTVGADHAVFNASANAVYFCHADGPIDKLFCVFHIDDNGRREPALELEFFE
ncbi:hypothetical protein BAE44_0022135 [Dichanthelium oligosanthes]|uniref:Uncharacterized protein n=1 Tax=Dichanthelium oligosanthes TaxID=888268 RepID=A0A1E5UVD4_9POAL|nr:hypothetical protein BAE44_0022135 [Dichanthelium oligosanthes]